MTRERKTFLSLSLIAIAVTAPAAAQDATLPPDPAETAPVAIEPVQPVAGSEHQCADAMDDDGDGMVDCADADCFDAVQCVAGGREERTDAACGDWIDNDGDG